MDEQLFLMEKARILMAQELNISPDDIDINSIYKSVFRAIRESCKKNNDEIIITIKDEQEEKAILSSYGPKIIDKIFANQYPFKGIAEYYESSYIFYILNHMNEGN